MRTPRFIHAFTAAALALTLAAAPAVAQPTQSQALLTPAQTAQLYQQLANGPAVRSGHAAINAKDLSSWTRPKGWEAMAKLVASKDPAVTTMFKAKAAREGTTVAQARANFLKSVDAGGVWTARFTSTSMKAFDNKGASLFNRSYTLAQRVPLGIMEVYFFKSTEGEKAGDHQWLIMLPPGPEKTKDGKPMAAHIHYIFGSSPFAIFPAIARGSMPTLLDANASWEAKLNLLRVGVENH